MEKNIKLSTDTDVLLDAFGLEKVYGGALIEVELYLEPINQVF